MKVIKIGEDSFCKIMYFEEYSNVDIRIFNPITFHHLTVVELKNVYRGGGGSLIVTRQGLMVRRFHTPA